MAIWGIVGAAAAAIGVYAFFKNRNTSDIDPKLKSETVHQFRVPALSGGEINFADFAGKKIMIVNSASKCGLTPQYEALQALHEKYADKLVIVGFPANNFLSQEPGSNEEIAAFCQKNYGVSFLMAEKISVKGKDQAPIYQWLTHESLNGVESSTVSWNFQKYLLDEQGKLIRHFSPKTPPDSPDIIEIIES